MDFVQGPDFPTGGLLMESHDAIVKAYETGRGALKIRSKWEKEDLGHGVYQIVITEIPYGVQKSDLIAKIAKMLNDKKLPMLNDIRDESAENVRVVLEPKNRTVDANYLMEYLFQHTDLQTSFHLNMNVLDADSTPKVMSLKQVLQAFLAHRMVVLTRCSEHRLDKILHRMEILQGFLITYLNLDRVIEIIRNEDEPKPLLMKEFNLSEVQVEAVLNMKLRSLRKLEEMQIKSEYDTLDAERKELQELLTNESLRWKKITEQIADINKRFGQKTKLGERRTIIADAPSTVEVPIEAMIEKEPITVVLSQKGWIRSLKGHVDVADIKFKEGDNLSCFVHTQTTDKILFFSDAGKFYTIMGDKIVGGRGFGEPVRLSFDLPEQDEIVTMLVADTQQNLLVASQSGKGFIVKTSDVIAQTRAGKIVLNVSDKDKAKICLPVTGDSVAIIGKNRKLLIFKTQEIPTMTRGSGVILQKYQGAQMSDIEFFNMEEGMPFAFGNGTRIERDLLGWIGKRAQVGKIPPVGFPRSNKFK